MIMRYFFILIIGVLVHHAILLGQTDRSQAPKPGPAPEIQIRDYKTFELKNGLKVFLVENHKILRVAYSLVLDMYPITEGDSMGYSTVMRCGINEGRYGMRDGMPAFHKGDPP